MRRPPVQPGSGPTSEAEVTQWLTGTVAKYVNLQPDQIAADVPLSDYGLDSVSAMTICAAIEDDLGLEVDLMIIWDHPTIAELAPALVERRGANPA